MVVGKVPSFSSSVVSVGFFFFSAYTHKDSSRAMNIKTASLDTDLLQQ